jgi:hypothetical protein
MADNNYQEGNSIEDLKAFTNPYACPTNSLKLKGIKHVGCCNYLASFGYVIAAGGATTTITPLTGNTSADLRYYRVTVSDGSISVANELDLASPTVAFVVDTSSLDASAAWTISFAGALAGGLGNADCSLCYDIHLCCGAAIAGVSGDSIPADWVNVSFLLKLTSAADANFTLFPTDGLEIADGESVDLTQFLSGGATQLTSASNLVFTIEMRKLTNSPSVTLAPTVNDSNSVFASFANTVSYPYAIEPSFDEVNNAVAIEDATPGQFTETITYLLSSEGVVPSVSFTLVTDVA